MVLVERVHGRSSCVVRYQELNAMNASSGTSWVQYVGDIKGEALA